MSNIIKIKHGLSIPIPENLEQYELGYAQKQLFIKDSNNEIIKLNFTTLANNTLPKDDAPESWYQLGNCIITYTTSFDDFDFPATQGTLVQFIDNNKGNDNINQIWFNKGFGRFYNRSGNSIAWESIGRLTWEQVYTSRDIIPIKNGGTGATTVTTVRNNLGLKKLATADFIDLTTDSATGILPLSKGGTGTDTLDQEVGLIAYGNNGVSLETISVQNQGFLYSSGGGKSLPYFVPVKDYIVYEGSTTSGKLTWKYRRWNSGVAEAWGNYEYNDTYYSNVAPFYGYYVNVNLPTGVFIERPNIQYQAYIGTGFAIPARQAQGNQIKVTLYMLGTDNASNVLCKLDMYAIGRWK